MKHTTHTSYTKLNNVNLEHIRLNPKSCLIKASYVTYKPIIRAGTGLMCGKTNNCPVQEVTND